MVAVNSSQLRRLLSVPDPKKETIFGVIGRMEVLISLFEQEQHFRCLLPFLKTYYFVTKKSAQRYIDRKRYFTYVRDYEELDIYFASLYFTPLYAYLDQKRYTSPWETYFRYCEKPDGIVFLKLLLGVNAHINGDLANALHDQSYRHEKDFFLVNDILLEVIPEVTKFMAVSQHDLFSTTGIVLKKFFLSEFHIVVEQWRSEAWVQANPGAAGKHSRAAIHKRAERIGKDLIKDFESGIPLPFLSHTLGSYRAVDR